MKTIDSPRFLQHMVGLACIAGLTVSCTTDLGNTSTLEPSPEAPAMDLDPTGNWNLTYKFGAGCGQPGSTATTTFTVTRTPDGYAVSAPGVTMTGTMLCIPDSCKLSGMFGWSTSDAQFQQSANIVLDASDDITGSGTEAVVVGTTTCGFTFTITGSKG